MIFNKSFSLKCIHVHYLVIAAFIWICVFWICTTSASKNCQTESLLWVYFSDYVVCAAIPCIKSLKSVHLSGAGAETRLWKETYSTKAGVLVRFLYLKFVAGVTFWPNSTSFNQIHILLEVFWPPSMLSALHLSRCPVTCDFSFLFCHSRRWSC